MRKHRSGIAIPLFAALVVLASAASPSLADNFLWTGRINGDWDNANNWVVESGTAGVYVATANFPGDSLVRIDQVQIDGLDADILDIAGTARGSKAVSLNVVVTIGSLTIGGTTPLGGDAASTTNTLTLNEDLTVGTISLVTTADGGLARFNRATLTQNGQDITVTGGTVSVVGVNGANAATLSNSSTNGTLSIGGTGALGGNFASISVNDLSIGAPTAGVVTVPPGAALSIEVKGDLVVAAGASLDLSLSSMSVGAVFPGTADADNRSGTIATVDGAVLNGNEFVVGKSVSTVVGDGSIACVNLRSTQGSGGGQTTTINTDLVVASAITVRDRHQITLGGTARFTSAAGTADWLSTPGNRRLAMSASGVLVFEFTGAGPHLVDADELTGTLGSLRFLGAPTTEFRYPESTTILALSGDLEVVSGRLTLTRNGDYTIGGSVSVGAPLAGGPTGEARLDASVVTTAGNEITVNGGDILFGAHAPLPIFNAPVSFVLNGSGNITLPTGFTATFAGLSVASGASTTTVLGAGTLRTTGVLTVGSGLLQGGASGGDTATIDIGGSGSGFSVASADFGAGSMTVRYSATGAASNVASVVYRNLEVATTGQQAQTTAPLQANGTLAVQSGTLRLNTGTTSISVGLAATVAGTLQANAGAAIAGTFTGGLAVSGAGQVSCNTGSISLGVGGAGLAVAGTASVATAGGAISVSAGGLSNTSTNLNAITTGGGALTVSAGDIGTSGSIATGAGAVSATTGNITVTGAGSITTSAPLSCGGSLSTAGGSSVSAQSFTVGGVVSNLGSLTIAAGSSAAGSLTTSGTLTFSSPLTLAVGGSWTSSGTFATGGVTSVIDLQGNGALSVTGHSLPSLVKSGVATTTSASTGAVITGSLGVTAGVLELNGQVVSVASGALVASGATLRDSIGAPGTLVLTGSGDLGGAGTTSLAALEVRGVTNMLGSVSTAGTLMVTTSGSLTTGAFGLAVGGLLDVQTNRIFNAAGATALTAGSITTSGTFTAPSLSMSVSGAFTIAAGTFAPSAGTVRFTGASAQTFSRGGASLASFVVQGAGGVNANQGLVFSGTGDIAGGPLNVTGGNLDVGAQLICASPVKLTGGTLVLASGTISGASTLTLDGVSYAGTTGAITVSEVIYDRSDVMATLDTASRVYGGALRFRGTAGTTFQLTGSATLSVAGDVNIETGVSVVAAAASPPTLLDLAGDLTFAGTGSLKASGFPRIQLAGDLAGVGAGYDLSPVPTTNTLELDGVVAQTLTPTLFGHLTLVAGKAGNASFTSTGSVEVSGAMSVLAGTLAPTLPSVLRVKGNVTIASGASYQPGATGLHFAGATMLLDQTDAQSFGDVTVETASALTLTSSVRMDDVVVQGSGAFTSGGFPVDVNGSWTIASTATYVSGASIVTFKGAATPVTIDTGGDAFRALTIAKASPAAVVTVAGGTLTTVLDLDIQSGQVTVSDVDVSIGETTSIEAGSALTLVHTGVRSTLFGGQVTLAPGAGPLVADGGKLEITNAAQASVVTFASGLVVSKLAAFIATQGSGALTFRFGANTFSRVGGPLADPADTVTRFELMGSTFPNPNFRLEMVGGGPGSQWFLGYNRATESQDPLVAKMRRLIVRDSDANAGLLVRAPQSKNDGGNENWSFGGDDKLRGTLLSSSGAAVTGVSRRLKLYRRNGPLVEISTADTLAATGAFDFELTLGTDDRIVVLVDGEPTIGATAALISDPGASQIITGFDVREGRLAMRRITSTAILDTTTLATMDSGAIGDSDVPFTVDGVTGTLTIAGTIALDVQATAAVTLTGNLITGGDASVDGLLGLGAGTTNSIGRDLTVNGGGAITGGNDMSVSGNLVLNGSGAYTGTTGTLTVAGVTGVTINGSGDLRGASLSLTTGGLNLAAASTGGVSMTAAVNAASASGKLTRAGTGSVKSGPLTIGGLGIVSSAASGGVESAGATVNGPVTFSGGGTFRANGVVDVAGEISFAGGSFRNDGTTTRLRANLSLAGADFQSSSTTIEGSVGLTVPSGASSITVTSLTLSNATADVRFSGSTGRLTAAGIVDIGRDLILDQTGAGDAYVNTGSTTVRRSLVLGSRRMRNGTDATVFGTVTTGAGDLEAGTGTFTILGTGAALSLNGSGNVTGALLSLPNASSAQVQSSGRIDFTGAAALPAGGVALNSSGDFRCGGATVGLGISSSGAGSFLSTAGATIGGAVGFSGSGAFAVSGALDVTGNVSMGTGALANAGPTSRFRGNVTLAGGGMSTAATTIEGTTGLTASGASSVTTTSLSVPSGSVDMGGSTGRLAAAGPVTIGVNLVLTQASGAGAAYTNTGSTTVGANLTLGARGFQGGGDLSVSGDASLLGAGGLVAGPGLFTVSGATGLTLDAAGGVTCGSLVVTPGRLRLNGSGDVDVASSITIGSGAALATASTGSLRGASLSVATGGVVASGTGDVVLTGGATVAGGVLFTGAGDFFASGTVLVSSGNLLIGPGDFVNTGASTTVQAGSISLRGADFLGGATSAFSGIATGPGASAITVTSLTVTSGGVSYPASSTGRLTAAGLVSVGGNLSLLQAGTGFTAYSNTGATSVTGDLALAGGDYQGGTTTSVTGAINLAGAGAFQGGAGLTSAASVSASGTGGLTAGSFQVAGSVILADDGGMTAVDGATGIGGALTIGDGAGDAAFFRSTGTTVSVTGAVSIQSAGGGTSATRGLVLGSGAATLGSLSAAGGADVLATAPLTIVGGLSVADGGLTSDVLAGPLTVGGSVSLQPGSTGGVTATALAVTGGVSIGGAGGVDAGAAATTIGGTVTIASSGGFRKTGGGAGTLAAGALVFAAGSSGDFSAVGTNSIGAVTQAGAPTGALRLPAASATTVPGDFTPPNLAIGDGATLTLSGNTAAVSLPDPLAPTPSQWTLVLASGTLTQTVSLTPGAALTANVVVRRAPGTTTFGSATSSLRSLLLESGTLNVVSLATAQGVTLAATAGTFTVTGAGSTMLVGGGLDIQGGNLAASDDAITVAGALSIAGTGALSGGAVSVTGPIVQTGGGYNAASTLAGQTLTVGGGTYTSASTTVTADLLVSAGSFASGRTDALANATLAGGAMNLSTAPGRAVVTGAFLQSAGTFTGGTAFTVLGTTTLLGGAHSAAGATLLGDSTTEPTQLGGATVAFTAGSAVTISGDFIQTAGSFNSTGADVTTRVRGSLLFSGGASPSSFRAGGRTTVDQNLVLAGLASSTFRGDGIAASVIDVGRSVLVDGATFFAPTTLNLGVLAGGDWSLKAGAVFDPLNGTVRFRSTGNVVGTTSTRFFNLEVDPARAVSILFDTDIDAAAIVGAGGSLSFSSSRITLSGANPLQGAGDFLAQGSTVVYDGTSGATIRSIDYNNLETLGDSAGDIFALTPLSDLFVGGDLTARQGVLRLIESGVDRTISIFGSLRVLAPARLDDQGVDLDVQGNWTVHDINSAIYSASPIVRLSGFLPRAITATTTVALDRVARFPTLHIDKSTSSGVVTLSDATDLLLDGDADVIFGRFLLSNRSMTVGGGDVTVRASGALSQGPNGVTTTAGTLTLRATGRLAGFGPLDIFTLAVDDGSGVVATTVSGTATIWDRVTLADSGTDRLVVDGTLVMHRDSPGLHFTGFNAASDFTATLSSLVAYRGATGVRDVDGTPILYHALELAASAGGTYRLVEDLSLTGGFTTTGGFDGNGFNVTFLDAVALSRATSAVLALNGSSISRVTVDKTLGGTVALTGPVATGRLDVLSGTLTVGAHDVTVAGPASVAPAGVIVSSGGTFTMATPSPAAATSLDVRGAATTSLGTLRVQNAGGTVAVTGGKLTTLAVAAITPIALDLATATLGPVDVSTTAGPSTIAGTALNAASVVLRAPTTVSTSALTIAAALDVRAAVTLAPSATVVIAGAPNPLTFAGGGLTAGAGSTIEFAGAGSVNVPGDGAGALTAGYRRVRFTGGGAYALLADATAEDVLVQSGALSANDVTLTIPGGAVGVAAAGELALRTTPASGTPGRLSITGPTAVSVSGTIRLLGSGSALPNPPAKPAIVTGTAAYTIEVKSGGRIEASRYAITGPGAAAGVLQIDAGATILGGNDGLREGTFTITNGTGLALNIAVSNQDLLLQEVRFEGAGAARNVRHATTLAGTTAPTTRLRFLKATTGDPLDAGRPGFPGTLWGDRHDIDFGAGDAGAAIDASPVSRGTVIWDDARPPTIVRITTQDLFDGFGVAVPNGAIDRIVVDFDESVSVASVNPAGFSIEGKTGARLVTTGITATSVTIDFVSATTDASIVGTAVKTVTYTASAGGILDENSGALASVSLPSIDGAGPTILSADYDNKASVSVAGDTLTLLFSEPVSAPPAASALVATGGYSLLGSESVASLGLDRAVVTLAAGSNGGVIPVPSSRIALAAGATTDLAAIPNATPASNRERPLRSAIDPNGAQAYELVVTAGAVTVTAGVSVEYTVRALDRDGAPIPGFKPRGGVRFEVVGADGVSTAGLETRPGDVSNFLPFSSAGLAVSFNAAVEPPVFTMGTTTQLTFDSAGELRVNLSDTKATANLAGPAGATRLRATEIATPATGILAGTLTWEHGPPAALLTLFGDGDLGTVEQGEELLVQGVRSREVAVAVSQTAGRIERTAGVTFTARAALVDEYFNLATRSSGVTVAIRPSPEAADPRRAANLDLTDGEPLDTPQDATLTAGISTLNVKTFLAALGHRYVGSVTSGIGAAGRPSTLCDVIPGAAQGVAVVLPGQQLRQGIASTVNPVEGTPFGSGLVAQGNAFDVTLFAVDAHGNWDFRYPGAATTNAVIVKVNDTVTSPTGTGDFEADTIAQRFGVSISAIGAGTAVPQGAENLSLAFNGGSPIGFDLDGRASGTEIRDLLQASLAIQTPLAARSARALYFPTFSRYVVRSGEATSPATRSEVVAALGASLTAEVNILRLGSDWAIGGAGPGDATFPPTEPGRGANELSALFYDAGAGAGADSDLDGAVPPSPDFERLGFVHGVAFASAKSDVDTAGLAFRRVLARFRTALGGTREFASDEFQVSQGALLVNRTQAFDEGPRDGSIDRIVITFEPSDTIDSVAAAQLTASDFRLTQTSGASTLIRSGVAVRADEVANTLEISFSPGLPTTATDGVTLIGPTVVFGKLTRIDLSGGISTIDDAAAPFVLSSRATEDTLEITFSEPIQVRAGRGASVSGVHDDQATIIVPVGASLVVTDTGAAPVTVSFAGGASGAASVVTVLRSFGVDAAFENNRFVIRSAAAATPSGASTLVVTPGVGTDAAVVLKLGLAETGQGAREVTGIFNPGEIEASDLLVVSRDGVDIRGGAAVVVGNKVIIPLARRAGDLTPPFFAIVDDFNQSFVSDASSAENAATFIVTNLPGLDTQNSAGASGFLQARERDAIPGDGIIEGVAPGLVETDIASSPLPAALVSEVRLGSITPLGVGQTTPRLLSPATTSALPLVLGSSLARSQVGLAVLSPGSYALTFLVRLTGDVPLGLAATSLNEIARTFTIRVDDLPAVPAPPAGPIVVAPGASFTLDGSSSRDPNGQPVHFQWRHLSGPAVAAFSAPTSATTTVTIPSVAGVYTVELAVDDGAPSRAVAATVVIVAQGGSTSRVPTADAGLDKVVAPNDPSVVLDGGASFDPDGDTGLQYLWTQVEGTTVTLRTDSSEPAVARFRAPTEAALLRFRLSIFDGTHTSVGDEVVVQVVDPSGAGTPFLAVEPTGGTEEALGVPYRFSRVDRTVTLDAQGSVGLPRVTTYSWTQVGGPTIDLKPSGDTAVFTPIQTGTYTFRLSGSSQGAAGRDAEVAVRIVGAAGTPPVAAIDAPEDGATVSVGSPVSLVTNASGPGLRFAWRQIAGPLAPLSSPAAATTLLTPPETGVYQFEVTVTDPATGATDRARVRFGADAPGDRLPVAVFDEVVDATTERTSTLVGDSSTDDVVPTSQLSFDFVQVEGLPALLSGSGSRSSRQGLTPRAAGPYALELVVSDGVRRSIPARRRFLVAESSSGGGATAPTSGAGGGGGGGCTAVAPASAADALGAVLPLAFLLAALAWVRVGSGAARRLPRAAALAALIAAPLLAQGCAAGLIGVTVVALSGGGGGSTPDTTKPDLVLSSVTGPTAALLVDDTDPVTTLPRQRIAFLGDEGRLRANVMNQGDDISGTPLQVEWYLSRTKSIDATAFRVRALESSSTDVPAGGALRVVSEPDLAQVVRPETSDALLEPGRYALLARVNPNGNLPEHDDTNNDALATSPIEVYLATGPLPTTGSADIVITSFETTTAALTSSTRTALVRFTNVGAPIAAPMSVTYTVLLTTNDTLTGAVIVASGAFTVTPTAAETPMTRTITYESPVAGRFRMAIRFIASDASADDNSRFASTSTSFYDVNVLAGGGANLPLTAPGDPTILDVTSQRPALQTSLPAGGRRTLSFRLPDTGVDPARVQALLTVASRDFDPVIELLSPAGSSIRVVDDFRGSTRSVVYDALVAQRGGAFFFLVVGADDPTASGTFTVGVNVNGFVPGDDDLVQAIDAGDLVSSGPEDVPLDEATSYVMPITFRSIETEVFFEAPAAGRFPIMIRPSGPTRPVDPLFLDERETTLVQVTSEGTALEIPFVIERGVDGSLLLLSTEDDGLFGLTAGPYILVLRAQSLPVSLEQPFEVVIGSGVVFDRSIR